MNPQTSKYVTSLKALPHIRGYTSIYFFRILSIIKMKFGQIIPATYDKHFQLVFSSIVRLETSSKP